jgi:ABC-type uncharacterized transport system permease subunit
LYAYAVTSFKNLKGILILFLKNLKNNKIKMFDEKLPTFFNLNQKYLNAVYSIQNAL